MKFTMRNISGILAAALAATVVGGCQSQQPKQTTAMASQSVLDVTPVKAARPYSAGPQYVSPPDEPTAAPIVTPVYASTPDATPAPQWHKKPSPDGAVGGKYTVKKGDTLYRIAKVQYGDGKKWTQIASANPGITPQTLKVGQTIVVP
jgi:nucleoid-associated protein YgaU